MNSNISNQYYQQKKILLKQCLQLSEELIGSMEDWDSIPDIMLRKEAAILQLKELEESTVPSVKASLSQEMKLELDQAIKLIQDLDHDTVKLISKEQQNIKDSLKANINGQKLIQYAQLPDISKGRKLDYKK